MTWTLIAYGAGLFYFAARQDKVINKNRFRIAWIIFASIPLSHFFFILLRANNVNMRKPSPRMAGNLASIELWSSGVEWLLLAISLIVLMTAIIPNDTVNSKPSAKLSDSIPEPDKKDVPSYP